MLGAMDFTDRDGQLMLRYGQGDIRAFETLYTRYKNPLYRYLLQQVRNSAVANDLFQEVWSRVVAARHSYVVRAKFATFLFRIAHNCAIDYYRRQRATPVQNAADDAFGPFCEPQGPECDRPDRLAEYSEQQATLLRALAALPAEQREVFLLHEEGDLGIEEIARITRVGIETAKSRLRYAVRKLRKALSDGAAPPAATDALAVAATSPAAASGAPVRLRARAISGAMHR